MKKIYKFTKIGLVLTLCLCMLCGTARADTAETFPDVPADATYAEAVEVLAELGIFQGDNYGNFNPDKTITRAEAAAVICRLLGLEDEAKAIKTTVFSDVPSTNWAVGYVSKAADLGIVNGYGNGKFGPLDPVTQEQIIKMLVCARGYDIEAQKEGGYPSGYIAIAQKLGITDGINSLMTESAPRSVVAQLVYNTMQVGHLDDEDMYEWQEW